MKCQQGYTAGIWYYLYKVLGYHTYDSVAWWVANQSTISEVRDHFPKEQEKNLLFNTYVKNFPLKTNGGETESVILLFF